MRFTLLITQPPDSPVAFKALAFAEALLHQGHEINRLFFFAAGVEQAHQDADIATKWQALVEQQQLDTTVCSGSAAQHAIDTTNCRLPIAGMGDWLMATLDSDRLVEF